MKIISVHTWPNTSWEQETIPKLSFNSLFGTFATKKCSILYFWNLGHQPINHIHVQKLDHQSMHQGVVISNCESDLFRSLFSSNKADLEQASRSKTAPKTPCCVVWNSKKNTPRTKYTPRTFALHQEADKRTWPFTYVRAKQNDLLPWTPHLKSRLQYWCLPQSEFSAQLNISQHFQCFCLDIFQPRLIEAVGGLLTSAVTLEWAPGGFNAWTRVRGWFEPPPPPSFWQKCQIKLGLAEEPPKPFVQRARDRLRTTWHDLLLKVGLIETKTTYLDEVQMKARHVADWMKLMVHGAPEPTHKMVWRRAVAWATSVFEKEPEPGFYKIAVNKVAAFCDRAFEIANKAPMVTLILGAWILALVAQGIAYVWLGEKTDHQSSQVQNEMDVSLWCNKPISESCCTLSNIPKCQDLVTSWSKWYWQHYFFVQHLVVLICSQEGQGGTRGWADRARQPHPRRAECDGRRESAHLQEEEGPPRRLNVCAKTYSLNFFWRKHDCSKFGFPAAITTKPKDDYRSDFGSTAATIKLQNFTQNLNEQQKIWTGCCSRHDQDNHQDEKPRSRSSETQRIQPTTTSTTVCRRNLHWLKRSPASLETDTLSFTHSATNVQHESSLNFLKFHTFHLSEFLQQKARAEFHNQTSIKPYSPMNFCNGKPLRWVRRNGRTVGSGLVPCRISLPNLHQTVFFHEISATESHYGEYIAEFHHQTKYEPSLILSLQKKLSVKPHSDRCICRHDTGSLCDENSSQCVSPLLHVISSLSVASMSYQLYQYQ